MDDCEYRKTEPCWLTKNSVHSLAEDVASQLELSPGADLAPVLSKIGGNLKVKDFWDLEDDNAESLEVHGEGEFDIYVPSVTSVSSDRFTIAHEIGHYVLHYLLPRRRDRAIDRVYATRYGNNREEWEANWFASAFLMPSKDFVEAFGIDDDISTLAKRFNVSKRAAATRAESLGLFPKGNGSERAVEERSEA